jgi:hypothetical protein
VSTKSKEIELLPNALTLVHQSNVFGRAGEMPSQQIGQGAARASQLSLHINSESRNDWASGKTGGGQQQRALVKCK